MRPKKQQARVVFKHDEYNTRVLLVLRLEQHLFGALLHRLQRAETRRGAVFQRAHDQQQAAAVCDDDAAVRVVRRESNVSQTNARARAGVFFYKKENAYFPIRKRSSADVHECFVLQCSATTERKTGHSQTRELRIRTRASCTCKQSGLLSMRHHCAQTTTPTASTRSLQFTHTHMQKKNKNTKEIRYASDERNERRRRSLIKQQTQCARVLRTYARNAR